MVVIAEACPSPDTGRGGAGVSEANGVLRNHYHPPGANINLKAHLFLQ